MTNDTSKTDRNVLERLKQILGTKITLKGLVEAGRWIARRANELLPGASGAEKKAWAKSHLLEVIEKFDDRAPVIGAFLDLPVVDGLEKSAVDVAVEKGYAWLVATGGEDAPVTDTPELQEGGVE